MKTIKLLRIINTLNPASGGPPSGILHVTPYLNQINIETTIVCLDDPNDSFLINYETKLVCLGNGKTIWNFNPKMSLWLQSNLKNYDVSIVHGIWQYHTYAALNVFINIKKSDPTIKHKMFIFPHGMLDPYFQQWKQRGIKTVRNTIYWQLIEKRNINHSNGLLFTTKKEMELAQQTFKGFFPKQKFHVGYGVSLPTQNIENKSKYKNYLLFFGRINEKKGIDLILKAYILLNVQCLSLLPTLVIAGPVDDPSYERKIRQTVKKNKVLKDLVKFLPAQSGKYKWNLIKHAKAQILWSYQENFGISVAESLGMGVPVLLSKNVNIAELVENEKAGMVAEMNLNALTLSLLEFLEMDDDSLQTMSKNAIQLYNHHFLPSKYAERLRAVFENE